MSASRGRLPQEAGPLSGERLPQDAGYLGGTRLPRDPGYLRDLFNRHARSYDPVNRLISLGMVALWRRRLLELASVRPRERVLDAFCGPGSLGILAARRLGAEGELVFADLSPAMLRLARENLRKACGSAARPPATCPVVRFVQGDVLRWPGVPRFDVVLLGFGLRYTADPAAALARLAGLLRPDGRLAVLEFTAQAQRGAAWAALPRGYFHGLLPALAGRLGRDREMYDYLNASSHSFLTAAELRSAAARAGLGNFSVTLRLGGVVCLLTGTKSVATS